MTEQDWRHRARCRGHDPELWFPVGTTGPAEEQIKDAKAICRLCPVLKECRAWALAALDYGIAGGLTEEERRVERRKVRKRAS